MKGKAMEPQVITTPEQYERAVEELQRLMVLDPRRGTSDANRLELFALLIEKYETEHFPIDVPTPSEAIRFRMEEQDLSPKDLEPFIGSRSKVSEVLSGKVPLSLRMIRELNRGLGIPYEVLLQEGSGPSEELDWAKVPIAEMAKLGWLRADKAALRTKKESLAKTFFGTLTPAAAPVGALLRRSAHSRSTSKVDREALAAWLVQATRRSAEIKLSVPFKKAALDANFLATVARQSAEADGPIGVRSLLLSRGVIFVVVPHLSRTRLDGAAFLRDDGCAVIALTLRYDRLDSFWFTLLHELVHLARHSGDVPVFLDDLDVLMGKDPIEVEADALARDAVVPRHIWRSSDAYRLRTAPAVLALSNSVGVHPALIAGRLRYETKNYHLLNNFVGHGEVRRLFRAELGDF